jgi:hypothetical protein
MAISSPSEKECCDLFDDLEEAQRLSRLELTDCKLYCN